MAKRIFKVQEPCMNLTGSELRFRGKWLENAGFPPGANVAVIQHGTGVIELRVIQPAEMADLNSPPLSSHPSLPGF